MLGDSDKAARKRAVWRFSCAQEYHRRLSFGSFFPGTQELDSVLNNITSESKFRFVSNFRFVSVRNLYEPLDFPDEGCEARTICSWDMLVGMVSPCST